MFRNLIVIIFLCNLFPADIHAQENLPVLKDVLVESTVKFDKNTKLYEYSYFISNPAMNTGNIYYIEIDISTLPQSQELSADGLIIHKGTSRKGKILMSSFKEELADYGSRMQKPIVPVGIQPPTGWDSGISVIGTANWGAGDNNLLMPGQSLTGFLIKSRGIPAIREIAIQPWWVLFVEDASDEDVERSEKVKKEIAFYTKTIGPTAPPADFKPVEFLDYIINIKHEAALLGWIKNKGIEQSLDAKLENAKKKITQGKTNTAKEILKAFINEVEAQGCPSYEDCPPGKHLTSEAYALLVYNTWYLIEQL